jgi:hypothetical protein
MTIDDTAIIAGIAALAGGIVTMWHLMRSRYETDIKCLRSDLVDAISRIRKLEDWRTEQLKKLADRYDESVLAAAQAIKELAANLNANTDALRGCNLHQAHLPEPHPAADASTDTLIRKEL